MGAMPRFFSDSNQKILLKKEKDSLLQYLNFPIFKDNIMEMEILKEKENPFLKRKEVLIRVFHPGSPTPSKEKAREMIASKFSCEKEKIDIVYIFSDTGIASTKIKFYIPL